jgi:3-hydroxybutyryl-CoA dehydrogenase
MKVFAKKSLTKNFSFNYLFKQQKRLFQNIGVVGAGQMGTGIALVYSKIANKQVVLYDSNETQIRKSNEFLIKLLDKDISKGKLQEAEKQEILKRMTFTTNIDKLTSANLIVEAVTENFDIKSKIFQQLDSITPNDTVLASNTSSISITKLASSVKRPDKVIGMHFMNPVPVMKLVEVIRGLPTSDDTYNKIINSIKEIKKESVLSADNPGFIVNRILMPMINEAVFVLQEGIATKEDIDKGMVLGTAVPMGPLTLADFIGLDTCLYIMNVLYSEIKDSKYRPCTLLVNYVNAGWLGRKSGKGFYDYTAKQ